jgi:CheY-like chemotaxis protein
MWGRKIDDAIICDLLMSQIHHYWSRNTINATGDTKRRSRGASKACVFVIDDNEVDLESARGILGPAGYDVRTFNSPLGTSRALHETPPDLILIDVMMPALDGDKLIPLIRAVKGARDALLILISVKPGHELRTLAARCGADGFIEKTAEPGKLVRAVDSFLVMHMKDLPS